jgi:methyltransferase
MTVSAVLARSALYGALVFGLMLVEARRAAANERRQRARGGIEPPGDVYRLMRIAYPGAFLAMILEGFWRDRIPPTLAAGAILFGISKALKYWAIATLGPSWTFRVIVVPGAELVEAGPYRFTRHPNYVAVVGELIGVALMTGAVASGIAATAGFGWLLLRRLDVEQRALATLAAPPKHSADAGSEPNRCENRQI